MQLFSKEAFIELLLRIPIVLIALSVHEAAHAYASYRLGDPTARNFGRITLNPAKHFDPIGALCLLLFRFGWAKPVPVNTRHFKNPRRDMALTALAGPMSNVLLGFLGILLLKLLTLLLPLMPPTTIFSFNLYTQTVGFLYEFHWINLSFAVFNMLPIPPFDGSRVFLTFLPAKQYFAVMKYERYIMFALFFLIWAGYLTIPLSFIVNKISGLMLWIVNL